MTLSQLKSWKRRYACHRRSTVNFGEEAVVLYLKKLARNAFLPVNVNIVKNT